MTSTCLLVCASYFQAFRDGCSSVRCQPLRAYAAVDMYVAMMSDAFRCELQPQWTCRGRWWLGRAVSAESVRSLSFQYVFEVLMSFLLGLDSLVSLVFLIRQRCCLCCGEFTIDMLPPRLAILVTILAPPVYVIQIGKSKSQELILVRPTRRSFRTWRWSRALDMAPFYCDTRAGPPGNQKLRCIFRKPRLYFLE